MRPLRAGSLWVCAPPELCTPEAGRPAGGHRPRQGHLVGGWGAGCPGSLSGTREPPRMWGRGGQGLRGAEGDDGTGAPRGPVGAADASPQAWRTLEGTWLGEKRVEER